MAAARQSYEETDVAAALRTTYPDNLWTTSRSHHPVNVVDHALETPEEDEQADEVQEVLAAFNEEDPQMEDHNEPIEEQDAIDVLLSWKQTRTQINREKLSRGLGGSQDLRKLEARVKCFKCQKVGHFSRNCPLRKSKGKGSGKGDTTSSQSSRVSFVYMMQDVEDEDYVMVNAGLDCGGRGDGNSGRMGRPPQGLLERRRIKGDPTPCGPSQLDVQSVKKWMPGAFVVAEPSKADRDDRHGWRDRRAVHTELEKCLRNPPTEPVPVDREDHLLQAGESPGPGRGGCD